MRSSRNFGKELNESERLMDNALECFGLVSVYSPLSPDNVPRSLCLYLHQIGEVWAAMIMGNADPRGPGELKGLAFFAAAPEEA